MPYTKRGAAGPGGPIPPYPPPALPATLLPPQLSVRDYMEEVLRDVPGSGEAIRAKNQVGGRVTVLWCSARAFSVCPGHLAARRAADRMPGQDHVGREGVIMLGQPARAQHVSETPPQPGVPLNDGAQ